MVEGNPTLVWDLGRGEERFEGEDERECVKKALESRGWVITLGNDEVVMKIRDNTWSFNTSDRGLDIAKQMMSVAVKEYLPFGIIRFEKMIGGVKMVARSLSSSEEYAK